MREGHGPLHMHAGTIRTAVLLRIGERQRSRSKTFGGKRRQDSGYAAHGRRE